MKFVIPGKPIALKRHRHFDGGTFDPQKKEKRDYADHVAWDFPGDPISQAMVVEIDYVYVPPESWSQKKKEAALGALKTTTPDLSNLIKFTEDALNGVIWEDDRYIVQLKAKKIYGNEECTIIYVEMLNEERGCENESHL